MHSINENGKQVSLVSLSLFCTDAMGCGSSASIPPAQRPVPAGKTRICIAGYKISHHTGRARKIVGLIAAKYPDTYESWMYFDGSSAFYAFLKEKFDPVPFPPHLKGHASSPFIWFETGATNVIEPVGGRSHLAEWVLKTFPGDAELIKLASSGPGLTEGFHNGADAPQSTADIRPITAA